MSILLRKAKLHLFPLTPYSQEGDAKLVLIKTVRGFWFWLCFFF